MALAQSCTAVVGAYHTWVHVVLTVILQGEHGYPHREVKGLALRQEALTWQSLLRIQVSPGLCLLFPNHYPAPFLPLTTDVTFLLCFICVIMPRLHPCSSITINATLRVADGRNENNSKRWIQIRASYCLISYPASSFRFSSLKLTLVNSIYISVLLALPLPSSVNLEQSWSLRVSILSSIRRDW